MTRSLAYSLLNCVLNRNPIQVALFSGSCIVGPRKTLSSISRSLDVSGLTVQIRSRAAGVALLAGDEVVLHAWFPNVVDMRPGDLTGCTVNLDLPQRAVDLINEVMQSMAVVSEPPPNKPEPEKLIAPQEPTLPEWVKRVIDL